MKMVVGWLHCGGGGRGRRAIGGAIEHRTFGRVRNGHGLRGVIASRTRTEGGCRCSIAPGRRVAATASTPSPKHLQAPSPLRSNGHEPSSAELAQTLQRITALATGHFLNGARKSCAHMKARGIARTEFTNSPYRNSLCRRQLLNDSSEFIFANSRWGILCRTSWKYTHEHERNVALSTAYCEGLSVCTRPDALADYMTVNSFPDR